MRLARRTRWVMTLPLALVLLTTGRLEAKQADFDEYDRLLEQTQDAHQAIVDAGSSPSDTVLEHAISSDTALIDWIEAYVASDEFGELDSEGQGVLIDSLHVARFLRASARVTLGECEDARAELATLLDQTDLADPMRPNVQSTLDQAEECANRSTVATLRIDCQPPDADVAIDGVPMGLASRTYEVDPGPHVVTLSAPDYETQELPIEVAADQQTVALGPIELRPTTQPPIEGSGDALWPPTWYEWTLWGAGVVFIAVGGAFWANARDIEDQAERANNGAVDPVNQDAIDAEQTRAIVLWTLGIASIAVGTVLFFVFDNDESSPEAGSVSLRAGGVTFWF